MIMELGFKLFLYLLKIFRWILSPYYWYQGIKKKVTVPASTEPLLRISATELARKIRRKELTSVQVVTAYIDRIKQVNPQLNAVVQDRFKDALKDAEAVDELISSGKFSEEELEKSKPLLGVPFTVKESCGLQGLSYSVGSVPRIGIKAASDGVAVSNARNAGGIPLAVTNTPEYCYALEATNFVTGATNNPYDLKRTSGGSSGGEGALLASGGSVIGIGSDIGGSIRVPGMFNGIFGHKPSAGVVSLKGHFPNSSDERFQNSLVIGPMARYAEDLRLMLKIMAGENAKKLRLDEKVEINKVKVVYIEEIEDDNKSIMTQVDKDIKNVLMKCVEYFKKKCDEKPRKYQIQGLEESLEIACALMFNMGDLPNLLQDPKDPKVTQSLFSEVVKCIFGKSVFTFNALNFQFMFDTKLYLPDAKVQSFVNKLKEVKLRFEKGLLDSGVYIFPTFPIPAPLHNEIALHLSGCRYSIIFNLLGFPSTHVPLGLNRNGLPIGVQIVATQNNDRLCLAVAEELEKQFGGWVPVPAQ